MEQRECPHCWVALVPEKRAVLGPDITVDVCTECSGEFLDKGEIKRLTGDRDLHKLLTDYLGIDSDSELVCPSCGGLMDAELLEVDDDTTVEVDVCLECKGLWLDDGELEKLQKATADFGDLNEAKMAEIFDEKVAESRRKKALGGLLGRLRR